MRKYILILFLMLSWLSVKAQLLAPLSEDMNRFTERQMSFSDRSFFTIWKPNYDGQTLGAARQDSLALFGSEQPRRTWLGRKLFQESFLQIDSPDFYLYADPLMDFEKGKESPGKEAYVNTRGFRAGVRIGRKFAIGTTFYENQASFTRALNDYVDSFRIVPGQGRVHNQTTYDWDYAHSSGYLSFSPVDWLNLQLGQGKNFLGDGYRSLLLSDFSYSYPYLRVTWQTKRLMYSWMLAQTDIYKTNASDRFVFRYNVLGIHLLSVNVTDWIQLSAIQQSLFYHPDTLTRFKLTSDMLNPVMMPLFSKSNVHSMWGANVKIWLAPGLFVYNQWMFDNLGGIGTVRKGVQAGFKYFGCGALNGLFAQGEFNRVEAGVYTNSEKGMDWRHYNQPMAHPYGNHFEEYLANISWQLKRWQLSGRCVYAQPLADVADAQAFRTSGISYWEHRYLLTRNVQITYYLNTKTLMRFTAGYTLRDEKKNEVKTSTVYIYVAFRTGLQRREFDL
jgi:hypothetical protein